MNPTLTLGYYLVTKKIIVNFLLNYSFLRKLEFLSSLQKIMLIWGEEDKLFDIELARKMKE
jgi:hypothetical protein